MVTEVSMRINDKYNPDAAAPGSPLSAATEDPEGAVVASQV